MHEAAIALPMAAADALRLLKVQGILGGLDLKPYFPELGEALLVCATETKTDADLARYAENLARIVSKKVDLPPCARKREA